jgi:cytochrome c biogenesis factor
VDNSAILVLGIVGFTLCVLAMFIVSILWASRESVRNAKLNQQKNQSVSNGYAVLTAVVVIVVFGLALFLGILPPILRRG